MGHGGAGGVGVGGELLVDAPRQGEPVGRIDLGAAHVDHLLRYHLGQFVGLRDPGQHFLDGQLLPTVAVVGEIGASFANE